jgi:signal transduction histidine kinase
LNFFFRSFDPISADAAAGLIATTPAAAAIAEVFRNYLSNALKYAPERQPIVVDLIREGKDIGFYVRDLGTPIQGSDREAIFQRSVQLANGKSRGSGLGLAIVKRIAVVHGAEVGVFPNEPTGNVFFMKYPAPQTDNDTNDNTGRT